MQTDIYKKIVNAGRRMQRDTTISNFNEFSEEYELAYQCLQELGITLCIDETEMEEGTAILSFNKYVPAHIAYPHINFV